MMHLPLSVQALRTRDRCRRQFALQYVQGQYWPGVVREPSADMRLGEAFHKLVVRHRLGLPVRPDVDLADVWARFLASPYATQSEHEQVFSEQALQFSLEGVPFLVRCDEIRRDGERWVILDWKTGHVRASELANHWQTRLYRFALAMAGTSLGAGEGIPAENIMMVYLLVRLEKVLEFPYDRDAFEADRALFTEIARQADAPAESRPWPDDLETCRTCRYDTYCNARPAMPVVSVAPAVPRFVCQETLQCGT